MTAAPSLGRSVRWAASSQALRQGVQSLTLIALAALLSPDDFGLMNLATVVIGFLTIFANLGTGSAIVQRKDPSDALLSSVFWVNVIVGAALALIVVLIAPLVAGFYNEPEVIPLLRVLALSFVLTSLTIVQKALAEKALAFRKLALIEVAATVGGALAALIAALAGAAVWALVAQALVISAIVSAGLWMATRWHPSLMINRAEVRTVARFSLNLTGYEVVNYFARNADYILIGRFLGTTALGYYSLAYRLMLFPIQHIGQVMVRVMLPTMARLQDDHPALRRLYLRFSGAIALVAFPAMLGIGAVMPALVGVIGAQWTPTIPLVVVLMLVGAGQAVNSILGVIYQVTGRTDRLMQWGIMASIAWVLAFVAGLRGGVLGVAVGYALMYFAIAPVGYHMGFALIGLRLGDLGRVIWRPALCAALMFGGVTALDSTLSVAPLIRLVALVAAGGVLYAGATVLFNREMVLSLRRQAVV